MYKRAKVTNAVVAVLTVSVIVGYQGMVYAGTPGANIVLALRAREVIVGFEDGSMRWEDGLTRAQAAKIMATAMGLQEQIESSLSLRSVFPDVPRTHWSFGTVNLAGELGLIKGFPDGTFKPDRKVTNAEYSVMLSRMYKALGGLAQGGTGVSQFEPKWAVDEISGCTDLVFALNFKAGDSLDYELPRGEAAVLTYTLMDRFGLLYDIRGTVVDIGTEKITLRQYGLQEVVSINTGAQTKYIQGESIVSPEKSFSGKEARIILDRDGNCALVVIK
jgi:hypothetical protein